MESKLFPHEKIRDVQDYLINDVYNAIINKSHILLHAPTGIGKSAGVLSPALTFSLENDKTIFFLTNRHTQHKIILETLEKMRSKHNINLSVADFIGKKLMCLQPGASVLRSNEFYDYCSNLVEKKGCEFYINLKHKNELSNRAKIALSDIRNRVVGVEEVFKISDKNSVCPYEITSLVAREANVIIADYYYILNPSIRDNLLKRMDKELEDMIIIIDETHNLPGRIRELMSINISTFILDAAAKESKQLDYEEVAGQINKISDILGKFASKISIDKSEMLMVRGEFIDEVSRVDDYKDLINKLKFVADQALELKKKSFSNSVVNFLEAWLGPDEGFTRIISRELKRDRLFINLNYRCLDPSLLMQEIAKRSLIIGMSGTLNPVNMFKDLLGINAITKEYKDPFPKQNRLNLIVPLTTTKFTKRNIVMYKNIANLCADMTNVIPGNSIVFFPSYQIRDEVYEYFKDCCEKTMFLEQQNQNKGEKEEMLDRFKSFKDSGSVLLGANAGSFAEGIDLPGDLLKAVIIVGLPLTKPDLETQELIKYYDKKFENGWDYGYIMPAMVKTIQAAGRCIRSHEDRGVIIFLDERYLWKNYRKYFPNDWEVDVERNPVDKIKRFFDDS